ncbi:MAG: hypothetical protein JSW32_02150 [Deltaproteobacteria bacterium]|nr:MAG: hypothetical protein JSW32_02150 [Deltaproteobacteria bacterium]
MNEKVTAFDQRRSMVISGIWTGTPLETTGAAKKDVLEQVASLIGEIPDSYPAPQVQCCVGQQAERFCRRVPFYRERLPKD